MKKKILVFVVLLAMVLTLGGCREEPTPTPPAEVADDATADDAADVDDVVEDDVAEDDGADDDTAATDDPPADVITVSVVNWEIEQAFAGEPCAINLYIQERFGLAFEPYHVTWDNFREVPYLWAAAGTLPDIIGASDRITGPVFHEWIEAGVIRSLPDDLSRWPSLNHWVSQSFAQDLAYDGRIYHIPRGTTLVPGNTSMGRGLINRRDWREALDIPIPETEDDIIAMWQAFMDNDMHGDGTTVFGVYPHAVSHLFDQTFIGHGNTSGNWVYIDGEMVIPAFEESSLELMSFWRRAFNEGLVNPDFLTDADSTSIQQFALGRAGTLLRLVTPGHLFTVMEQWEILQPDVNFFEAVEILPPPRIEGKDWVVSGGPGHWSETLINARVDDATLERILDFYDWAMSDEGIKTMMFGFYGQDFIMEDGEVVMITDINPETGRPFSAGDLYAFAGSGMAYLATWAGDAAEWFNPNIPLEIRQMAAEYRDAVIVRPETRLSSPGIQVRALNIPEIVEMNLPSAGDEWIAFIMDTSNTSDEELWQQFRARWEAAGYLRAKELMTEEVLARGYPREMPYLLP